MRVHEEFGFMSLALRSEFWAEGEGWRPWVWIGDTRSLQSACDLPWAGWRMGEKEDPGRSPKEHEKRAEKLGPWKETRRQSP